MTDATRDSLKQSLTQLHAELARAPRLDDSTRQRLLAALADIERRVHVTDAIPVAGAAPTDTTPHPLEMLAVGFEADHPTLAASVRRFIDLLGQAGL
jgi:hypothetical protein